MYLLPIDELNRYFAPMRITEEERKKRIELAKEIGDVILLMFVLMKAEMAAGETLSADYYFDWLYRRYRNIAKEHTEIAKETDSDIKEKITDIINTTVKQANKAKDDSIYELSQERALIIAENESNYIRNDGLFVEAAKQGFQRKMWLSMRDSRVRHSHREVDGTILPIRSYFNVNGFLMRYPMDMSMNPDPGEVIGCRCSLEFL